MLSMLHWYHYTMYIAGLLTLFSVAARTAAENSDLFYGSEYVFDVCARDDA
jgi:hypothetical protein